MIQERVPNLRLNAWLQDDGHIVANLPELEKVVQILESEGPPRGLILSTAATVSPPSRPKTKVWCPLDISDETYPLGRGISRVPASSGIVVLGAPVGYENFVGEKLSEKVSQIESITEALPLLQNPQLEFVLLSSCLGLRKFMFFLRTTMTTDHQDLLLKFDSVTREGLSRILGLPLTHLQWRQAKLPVTLAGVGLHSAEDLAAVAYATSYLSSHSMVQDLLHPGDEDPPASLPQPLLTTLSDKLGEETSVESLHGVTQKMAARKVHLRQHHLLLEDFNTEAGQREVARLRCLGNPRAGDWLTVVPSPSLGLNLRSKEFTMALKYRLGCPLYSSESSCPACHQPSDVMGDHALGCGSDGERIMRHNLLRDVLHQTAAAAMLGPVKEGRFLLPGRDARPADLLIPRWSGGQDSALDVTVVSALQSAMVAGSATTDGYALQRAFDRKVANAGEACRREGITFIPIAANTLGGWHPVAIEQVKKLGIALARHQGQEEQEAVRHLQQRLSLVLMRGNAQLLVNRMPPDDLPEAEIDGIE